MNSDTIPCYSYKSRNLCLNSRNPNGSRRCNFINTCVDFDKQLLDKLKAIKLDLNTRHIEYIIDIDEELLNLNIDTEKYSAKYKKNYISLRPLFENEIITIIPSMSRFGDFKIKIVNLEQLHEIMNLYLDFLFSFTNTHIIPSVYDVFIIDNKLYYHELLLNYGLCDPDTIILYGSEHYINSENISLRTETTQKNIMNIIKKDFYLKFPFSGSNRCTMRISSDFWDNPNLTLDNIYIYLLQTIHKNNCIGKYYGLIIQPINSNFNRICNEITELRCICKKGVIDLVIKSDKNVPILINKVFFLTGIKNIKHIFTRFLLYLTYYSIDIYFINYKAFSKYSKTDYHNNIELITDILEKNNNIISICKESYRIIKKKLLLDNNIHRIDLIESRDNIKKYQINEIENINFGNRVNTCLKDRVYFPISDDILNFKPDISKILKIENIENFESVFKLFIVEEVVIFLKSLEKRFDSITKIEQEYMFNNGLSKKTILEIFSTLKIVMIDSYNKNCDKINTYIQANVDGVNLRVINKLIMPFTEFLPKPYGAYAQDNIREFYY